MDRKPASLEQLRLEIDRIDDAMHDLLMARTGVVQGLAGVKPPSAPIWRPAREAIIMRRLLARHSGDLPTAALVRLWREIIGIFAAQQGGVTVAAACQDHDAARGYFGGFARIINADPIGAVASAAADIAVMPWPGDRDGWWHEMPGGIMVSAVLPFAQTPTHVAVSRVPAEATGDDASWFACPEGANDGRIIARHGGWSLVQQPGLPVQGLAAVRRMVGSFAVPPGFAPA